MSQPPSQSRIAFWKGVAWHIDSHFGYGHPESYGGPCHYVVDRLEPETMFADLVCTAFVDDYLEAMSLVRGGAPSRIFTRDPSDRGHGFNVWWPEIDDKLVHLRDYLTDDLRSTLLDTTFKTKLFTLDHKALEASHKKLVEARDRVAESEPEWGAMYLIIRLFEATLVHVAWHHSKTRSMIERSVGKQGGEKLGERIQLASEQALASNKRWQRPLGQLEQKQAPGLRLIRGGK